MPDYFAATIRISSLFTPISGMLSGGTVMKLFSVTVHISPHQGDILVVAVAVSLFVASFPFGVGRSRATMPCRRAAAKGFLARWFPFFWSRR
jgi:hypothetical protein